MGNPNFALKTIVISLSAVLSGQAIAQDNSESQRTTIPRIDIVSSTPDAAKKQPGSVSIVTKEELELLQPLSTEDALRRVPGVNIKGEEESAVVANIGLRGLSSAEQKTLILEDGVPVAPGLFIGNGRYYNPRIQHIEGIEVLKGASSLRYGPSTIGGVINYKSKTPEDGVVISGRAGSFGLREGTLEAGGSTKSGDAQFGVVYTKAESDGFQNKGYKMDDLMVKAGMQIGDNQWVGIKFGHYENEANISYRGLFLQDYLDRKTYNPAPDDYFLTERNAFDVNHEWDINDTTTLKTVVYWSDVSRDYWRYGINQTASETSDRWDYADTLNGNNRSFERIGFDTRLNFAHNSFGVESQAEVGIRMLSEKSNDMTIGATRVADRTGTINKHKQDSADSVAVFAENRFAVNDRLSITPGLRVESYKQTQKDLKANNANESTSNTEILPGIGATYQIADAIQLFGGAYKAFSPAENKAALDGLIDQKLDAERSVNIELGLRGQADRLSYEVAAFQMDFTNQIVDSNIDNLTKANGGKTIHRGLEAALAYDFGGGFSFDSNLTYIPTSKFVGGKYAGNRISYSPEWLANVEFGYTNGDLKTALSAHHSGSQFGSSDNTVAIPANGAKGIWGGKLDAYTTFDLNALYRVNKQLTTFAAVKNLADKRYIAGLRQGIYAGPSRSFELGAKYKF